eukprot:4067538-Prymnesium_polylepis.4
MVAATEDRCVALWTERVMTRGTVASKVEPKLRRARGIEPVAASRISTIHKQTHVINAPISENKIGWRAAIVDAAAQHRCKTVQSYLCACAPARKVPVAHFDAGERAA